LKCALRTGVRALSFYRRITARLLNPFSSLTGLLLLIEVDRHQRYIEVAKEIVGSKICDIGAGGKSFFSLKWRDCVSVDIHKSLGVDIVASGTHLPFRFNSFDCVVCVDTIEHIPKTYRPLALEEIKRVAKMKAIVHTPVENGNIYRGRTYDLMFNEWYKKLNYYKEKNDQIKEHIVNVEPCPPELEAHGFKLRGTHNARLWLLYMQIICNFPWPLGILLGQLYYLINSKKDKRPPFWGAIGVSEKSLIGDFSLNLNH